MTRWLSILLALASCKADQSAEVVVYTSVDQVAAEAQDHCGIIG